MEPTLEILKLQVDRCRSSVKLAEAKYQTAIGTEEEVSFKNSLKSAKTKLETAENELRDFRLANRSKLTETVKSTGRKLFSWTGLAIVGTVTGVIGFVAYDHFGRKTEEAEVTDSF